jgi:hypothetical protein
MVILGMRYMRIYWSCINQATGKGRFQLILYGYNINSIICMFINYILGPREREDLYSIPSFLDKTFWQA